MFTYKHTRCGKIRHSIFLSLKNAPLLTWPFTISVRLCAVQKRRWTTWKAMKLWNVRSGRLDHASCHPTTWSCTWDCSRSWSPRPAWLSGWSGRLWPRLWSRCPRTTSWPGSLASCCCSSRGKGEEKKSTWDPGSCWESHTVPLQGQLWTRIEKERKLKSLK